MSQPGVPVCPGPPAEGDCGNDAPSWHCRPCLESRRPSTLGLRASSTTSTVLVCSDRRLGVRVRRPQRNAKMDRFRRRISRKKVTRPLGAAHISRCCHDISFYIFLRYSRHYYHLPSEPHRPHSSLEFDHRTLHSTDSPRMLGFGPSVSERLYARRPNESRSHHFFPRRCTGGGEPRLGVRDQVACSSKLTGKR